MRAGRLAGHPNDKPEPARWTITRTPGAGDIGTGPVVQATRMRAWRNSGHRGTNWSTRSRRTWASSAALHTARSNLARSGGSAYPQQPVSCPMSKAAAKFVNVRSANPDSHPRSGTCAGPSRPQAPGAATFSQAKERKDANSPAGRRFWGIQGAVRSCGRAYLRAGSSWSRPGSASWS